MSMFRDSRGSRSEPSELRTRDRDGSAHHMGRVVRSQRLNGAQMPEPGGQGEPDLGSVFDAHVSNEFVAKDLDATMATMVEEPYVTHIPTLAGGVGAEEVRRFYGAHFIGCWPDDVSITQISRTVGQNKVVDELIMNFTHDRVIDTFLPGVSPTGRSVRLPVVVVAGFEGDRVAYEHIYWDQASLLVQIGVLDPSQLPVSGVEQAVKLLDKDRPSNELIERAAGQESMR